MIGGRRAGAVLPRSGRNGVPVPLPAPAGTRGSLAPHGSPPRPLCRVASFRLPGRRMPSEPAALPGDVWWALVGRGRRCRGHRGSAPDPARREALACRGPEGARYWISCGCSRWLWPRCFLESGIYAVFNLGRIPEFQVVPKYPPSRLTSPSPLWVGHI